MTAKTTRIKKVAPKATTVAGATENVIVIQHAHIHLNEPHRSNAARAIYPIPDVPQIVGEDPDETNARYIAHAEKYAADYSARQGFSGPHFHNCRKVSFGEDMVLVELPGAELYMYPLATVARAHVYHSTHTPE